MAEKKESPRQKMIGMMYLVLTAMLALNVQREVLDAFVMLNEGIERAGEQHIEENNNLFAQFQMASSLDPVKTKPWIDAAEAVRSQAASILVQIEALQVELIAETEGLEQQEADTLQLRFAEKQDDINEGTRIMVGDNEDGSAGQAVLLRQNIENYVNDVNTLLASKNLSPVNAPIDFSAKSREGEMLPWEVASFYDMPFVATITTLEKIKNDVRRFEGEALQRMLGELDAEDFPIDTVLAKVIPKNPYVMLGETYEADVFLGGFSRTLSPNVLLGDLDEQGELLNEGTQLEVADGMGKYRVQANREGVHSYSGVVQMANKRGDIQSFPFSSSYIVARPSAVVSPTKMNVLYKGVDNPIAVSVPGVSNDKVRVAVTGNNQVNRSAEGYTVKLNNAARGTVNVVVQAEIDGNWTEMGKQEFRVKPLPEPYVRFGSVRGSGKMTSNEAKLAFMKAEYAPDFPFELPVRVTAFKMLIRKDNGNIIEKTSSSFRLTEAMRVNIENTRPGDVIIFENIIAKGEDNQEIPVPGITITIKR
ncbi:MAG: gliding motility protein GldM [Flavobacteriales bacterium]|nr:gliding motility protein GldM [Flavobacteriales bacterium]MDG2245521.1 gliding motility protein GldM [Flavobacteriales bacterium]